MTFRTLVCSIALALGCLAQQSLADEAIYRVGKTVVSLQVVELAEKAEKCAASGDFQAAARGFEAASLLAPKCPELHTNLASMYLHLNKYAQCISECQKALALNPDDASAWQTAAPAYQLHGELEKSAQAYRKYLALTPQGRGRQAYIEALKDVEGELKRRKLVPMGSDAADYFADVIPKGVFCWAKERMPLKVFIDDGAGVPGFRKEFIAIMKKSFTEWAEASNGKVSIMFVPSKNGCDISCSWTSDRSKFAAADEAGHASQDVYDDGVHHADIVMACKSMNYRVVSDESLHSNCLHEIGHALGLRGHSRRAEDIMFNYSAANEQSAVALTKRDAATIQTLYDHKFEIWPQTQRRPTKSSGH